MKSSKPFLLIALLAIVLFSTLLHSCRKNLEASQNVEANKFEHLKQEFASSNIKNMLVSRFTDSLQLVLHPDWESTKTETKSDSSHLYYVPLFPKLHSINSSLTFNVAEENGKKLLLATERKGSFTFNIITYTIPQGTANTKMKRNQGDSSLKVAIDDFTGNGIVLNYLKNGNTNYQMDQRTESKSYAKSYVTTSSMVCYYVCTYGFYCHSTGYTVTYTVNENSCLYPDPPPPCTSEPWLNGPGNTTWPQWILGNSERRCTPAGPTSVQPPNVNPNQFPPIGGSYSSQVTPIMTPILPDVNDSYAYTCPSAFTFVSITTNDLWQEAALTNLYVNLAYIGKTENISVRLDIPIVYFGLPYYNVEGKIVFTKMDAARIAADAVNMAEYRVRKAFSNYPRYTKAQLEEKWVENINFYMAQYSKTQGRAGRNGSINPATPIVARPYFSCQ